MTKRGYIMVITNLTNDITIPIRMVRLPLFPADKSRCEAARQKLRPRSFDIGKAWLLLFTSPLLWLSAVYTKGTGADPGFPVGGDANPPGGGRQHTNLPDFPKNCVKLRKFWSGGVRRGHPPWIRHWRHDGYWPISP